MSERREFATPTAGYATAQIIIVASDPNKYLRNIKIACSLFIMLYTYVPERMECQHFGYIVTL